jgi:hypothetical protein
MHWSIIMEWEIIIFSVELMVFLPSLIIIIYFKYFIKTFYFQQIYINKAKVNRALLKESIFKKVILNY